MSNAATVATQPLTLHDFEPEVDNFRAEVLHGLQQTQKTLPCKFFYDWKGSQLFESICELEEYYPTRTEMAIMCEHTPEIAAMLGPACLLIEYGSGSSIKTRVLLDNLTAPAGYVPIDISREHLLHSASALALVYPDLNVLPVCADYTGEFDLPADHGAAARRIVYFPGSTIGNFDVDQAQSFLRHVVTVCGPGGGLLIGVDLKKDPAILELAYNDLQGVTAAFNLNILERINRELGADFSLPQFQHRAFYNDAAGRVEMHLISQCDQTVHLPSGPSSTNSGDVYDDVEISFRDSESILTEYCYKYSLPEFEAMAASVGLSVEKVWLDRQQLFSVQYLRVNGSSV
jgi:dimethylhistidine N-methyltransferase